MQLLMGYIDHFGKFEKQKIDFKNDITVICEKNGYGKSTLFNFIIVMFYGFDNSKKLEENSNISMREHYLPFNSDTCGGSITLMHNQHQYKIDRSFGKTAKSDTLKVYVDNEYNAELSKKNDLGKFFFNVDKNVFSKTICISSRDITFISMNTRDAIKNSLVSFVDNVNSNTAISDIENSLEASIKELNSPQATVNLGLIQKLNMEKSKKMEEINVLNDKIKSLEDDKEQYEAARKRLAELSLTLEDYKIKLASENKLHEAALAQKDINSLNNQIDELNSRFPNGIMMPEEIYNAKHLKQLIKEEKNVAFEPQEDDELGRYFDQTTIPTKDNTEEVLADINDYTLFKAKLNAYENSDIYKTEQMLHDKFDNKGLDEETLAKALELASIYENHADYQTSNKNKIFAIISLIVIAFGIGIFFVNKIAGIILLVIGALCLIVTCIVCSKTKVLKEVEKEYEPLLKDDNLDQNVIKDKSLEGVLSSFVCAFCKEPVESYVETINKIKEDFTRYQAILKKEIDGNSVVDICKNELVYLEDKIKQFFDIYSYSCSNDTFLENYYNLLQDAQKYLRMNNCSNIALSEKGTRLKASLDKIIVKYQLSDDLEQDLAFHEEARIDFTNLNNKLSFLKENLKDVNNTNQLDRLTEVQLEQLISDTDNKITNIEKAIQDNYNDSNNIKSIIITLDNKIRAEELNKDYLNDCQNDLIVLENKLAEAAYELKIAEMTQNKLVEAHNNLIKKCIDPIKNGFDKYQNILNEVYNLNLCINIDKDLNVTYTLDGVTHTEDYLSDGQKSLIYLCLRLSLIDNMFDSFIPFLILDDPFVHLDDYNLKAAKQMLTKLSLDRQIVYFTCHESRNI